MDGKFMGHKLVELRAGMSQAELAEQLGLSREIISYLESGTRQPTLEQLRKLSGYFGCPIVYFYSDQKIARIKSAYRTSNLQGASKEVFEYGKKLLMNLYEMNERESEE